MRFRVWLGRAALNGATLLVALSMEWLFFASLFLANSVYGLFVLIPLFGGAHAIDRLLAPVREAAQPKTLFLASLRLLGLVPAIFLLIGVESHFTAERAYSETKSRIYPYVPAYRLEGAMKRAARDGLAANDPSLGYPAEVHAPSSSKYIDLLARRGYLDPETAAELKKHDTRVANLSRTSKWGTLAVVIEGTPVTVYKGGFCDPGLRFKNAPVDNPPLLAP